MAELEINGNATGALRAIDQTSKALDGLGRKAKATDVSPDGRKIRGLTSDVKALEAAGRVLGGRFGEATGALGDFADVAEAGLGPISALGIAVGAAAAGWGALAYGTVSATTAAINYGRANNVMTAGLRDADEAMRAVSESAGALTYDIGDLLAPGVAKAGYAFVGLIAAMRETVGAISDMADSRVGKLALAYFDLDVPLELAGMAFTSLEERGRAATAALEEQRIAATDLFKTYESAPSAVNPGSNRPAMPGAPAEQRAPYDQAAEQERIRLEIIRGLRQADLDDLRAYEAEAADIQMQSLAETMAAQQAATEAARRAAEEEARQWEDSYAIQRDAAQTTANAAIDLLGLVLGESKEAAIAMLILRKAQAIADIIINTQVAASAALSLGPAAPAAIAAIQAAGAAQVAVVAATGIAEGVALGAQPASQQGQTNNFTLVVDGMPRRNAVRQRGPVGQR